MAKDKKEQDYVIPFDKAMEGPRTKRANKAVRFVKNFVSKHWRNQNVVLTNEVNEAVWERGKFKLPRKIAVTTKEMDGKIRVYLKGSSLIKEEEKAKAEMEKKKKETEKAKEKEKQEKEKNEELQKKKEEMKEKEKTADKAQFKK